MRRRLNEEYVLRLISEQIKDSSKLERVARLKSWMPTVEYDDDQAVSNWIEENHAKLQKRVNELKQEVSRTKIMRLLKEDPNSAISAMKDYVERLSKEDKEKFLKALK